MTPDAMRFLQLVRDYLDGKVDWDVVHRFAVEMEWRNAAKFSEAESSLEELHMVFLADSRDDPQFRADRGEIEELVAAVDKSIAGRE
jgi:hypothetical protein